MRGINNKTEKLLSGNLIYPMCSAVQKPSESGITCTIIKSYNSGAYFSYKSKKSGHVSIFLHQNLQFTPNDLDEFCIDQEIDICAVKLHNFLLIFVF
jgi:hypothetical protein